MSPREQGVAEPFRLPQGGLIERGRMLSFTFDGERYTGRPGDTLASALLANGVHLVGRSFKYHRPRGIFTAGPEEPNALVELRGGARREPNSKATTVELYDGLEAKSQNRFPTLAFDLLSINALLSPFLAAGFYYKTFMWPARFWKALYEPIIRRSAGLGRASRETDPDIYEKAHAHCDVLVIGAGPTGLMAALAAARAGARVIVAEEDFRMGGRLLAEGFTLDGAPALDWADAVLAELDTMSHVRLMPRTTLYGVYDQGSYGAVERVNDHVAVPPEFEPRQRSWRIVAKQVVLASGALERGIAFSGNDRPGVMLASAVRAYVHRFGVAPGKRAVIFATCDDGRRTAEMLAGAGVEVVALVDGRDIAAQTHPWRVIKGAVESTHGGHHVRGVTVRDANGARIELACDLLALANGWNPSLHLTCHLGGRPVWNDAINAFVPGTVPEGMRVGGAAAGHLSLAEALADGARLGTEAAYAAGFDAESPDLPKVEGDAGTSSAPLWWIKGGRGPAFVDLQNDVTVKDIALAEREGYGAVEHLKRYTTLGMATDQGKTANVVGLAIMAELTGRSIPETGITVFRPPYAPISLGALAGRHRGMHFRPKRLPPSHGWAGTQGAVFAEAGPWLRAQWYQRAGEKRWQDSVAREAATVRAAAGVCDVSTLGKIDIQGPDAGVFLDRVYINKMQSLAVGKARYGVMLREDGFALDDGTVARLAEQHYVITTTTANAGKVMQHLEFCRQVLWPMLDLRLVSVSDQWAQYSIAGPRARDVLRRLVDADFDIANEALPRMGVAAVTISGGVPAHLFRVSFSGELAYEIAVPSRYGDALMRALMEAGAEWGIAPYGTEALNVLRIEKGHVGGPEFNGQTTARDLGLGGMMARDKDYIGRVLAERPALVAPERPILVGVKPVDPARPLSAGAHLLALGAGYVAANDEGHLTSVAASPELGHDIGLGFLAWGAERLGERIRAVDMLRKTDVECVVCSPIFIDPDGNRSRA